MQVQIVQLQQEMNFRTRKTMTYAVLELPNGKRVRLPVDEATASAIVAADIDSNGSPPAPAVDGAQSSFVESEPEEEDEPEDDVADYSAPPPQTTVLEETEELRVREFGGEETPAAPPKPPAKKRATKKQREKQQVERAAAALTAPEPAPAPPPPDPPQSHLPEGHVEPRSKAHYEKLVKEGKIVPNAFARHVPKDEYGYPIVQAAEGTADPQLVVGQSNQDEDGVGSI